MAKEQEIGAYSAYAIAVKHGYEGTEEEWIAEQEKNRKASEKAAFDANNAKEAAENAKDEAESAKSAAAGSATSAATSAAQAAQSASGAESAKTAAEHAQKAAENAKDDAESAKSAAAVSASLAQTSAAQAAGSAESADSAKAAAAQSAENAASSEANAAQAEERINTTVSGAVEVVTAQETKSVQAVVAQEQTSTAAVTAEGERVLGTIPADYTAAVGEIDTLKKSKAEIDDTAIDGDTWSSKHIVDTLCPKTEKTGTLVQMDGLVEGYPLGVKVSWTPTQEGEGDPSPENIRPIKGRDSVMVERCGENLIQFPYLYSKKEVNGLVIEPQQDGSIVVNGTATADTWYPINMNIEQHLPMNTIMTLSGCPAGGNTKRYYIGLYLGGKWFADVGAGNTSVSYKTHGTNSRIELSVIEGTVCKNLTFYPKLEIGNTITPYCKYQGGTLNLTLPSTVYGGEVDAEGKGQETWGCMDSYAGETLPAEWICDRAAYAVGTTPPNGAQVAYKLKEPVPFTATGGAAVPALPGTNTVLTDTDDMTVTGRADPIQTIAKLSNRIAALEAAATNITE